MKILKDTCAALLLLVVACGSGSDDKPPAVCAPGKTEECACVGGLTKGVQTCNDPGTAWGKCECPGDGGPIGAGGGGAQTCTPGTSEYCVCSEQCDISGRRTCDTLGNWSACDSSACQDTRRDFPQCF